MSKTHQRNQLTLGIEKLEERVMYSISSINSNLQLVLGAPTSTATTTIAPVNQAPTITQAITSSASLEVTGRSTVLRVTGADDQGAKNLIYKWSVVAAPSGSNVSFNVNGTNAAKQSQVNFTRAGAYTFKVDIIDQQGATVSSQIRLNVVPTVTSLSVRTPDSKPVTAGSPVNVTGSSQRLVVFGYDQFGQRILNPTSTSWSILSAPENAKPSVTSNGETGTFSFERSGSYLVQVKSGKVVTEVTLTLTPKVTGFSLSSGGNSIQANEALNLTTLNRRFDARTIDQFGKLFSSQAQLVWSATSTTLGSTASFTNVGGKTDAQFSRPGTYRVTVKGGAASQTFTLQVALGAGQAYYVSNASELSAAIKSADGNDEILLKGGVDFGNLKIYKPSQKYKETVTFKSEDRSNRAVLNSIILNDVSNVTIENVLIATENRSSAVSITGSDNIILKDSDVTANLDPYLAGQKLINGVDLRTSNRISFVNNTFRRLGTAMGVTGSSNVLVEGNTFKENLLDNSNFGSNISDVSIRRNTFYSQLAKLDPEHHYDNIQFYVQTDATQNSRNISVLENTIYDLGGAVNAQAIFGRGDYADENGVQNPFGFENVEIARNLIVSQQTNAIAFTDANGLRIHNNTLVYAGDRSKTPDDVTVPGIRYSKSINASIYDNIMPDKYGYPSNDTADFYRNTTYNVNTNELANILANPFASQITRDSFATLRLDTLATGNGNYRGAFSLSSNSVRPTAAFSHSVQMVDGVYVYSLDASQSLAKLGTNLKNSQFKWTFADGSEAFGLVVQKVFARSGVQNVKLTVIDSSGSSDTFVKEGLQVLSPNVASFSFDGDMRDNTSSQTKIVQTGRSKFVNKAGGGSVLALGGENGHLYIDKENDADLNAISMTKQFSFGLSFQANTKDNTKPLPLINQHGVWGVTVNNLTGSIQLALGGKIINFKPPVNLFDGKWHDVGMSVTSNSIAFFVDGKQAFASTLTKQQTDMIFQVGGYGLAIGGRGPWVADPAAAESTRFNIDNLYVGAIVKSEAEFAALALRNQISS
jgi:hypothetical protein